MKKQNVETNAVASVEIPQFPWKISLDDVANIIDSALGGYMSNCWVRDCTVVGGIRGSSRSYGGMIADGKTLILQVDRPDQDEGAGKGRVVMNLETLMLGVSIALIGDWTETPWFGRRHVNGDSCDEVSSDIILQCAVFGDVIYG